MTPAPPTRSLGKVGGIDRVFVVGAGIMGRGIAAQAALAGYPVDLADVRRELADAGAEGARALLRDGAARGRWTEAAAADAAARLRAVDGLGAAEEADLVIEAAPEQLDVKRRLFAELERRARTTAILATNTSSLPIREIGRELRSSDRLLGLHFFNPVLRMPLVELIRGASTRPDVAAAARRFAEGLGKTVVESNDTPGFVTTRALGVLLNEAVEMLESGVATRDDIDAAYRLGFHHPMGPFELADLVGLDTALAILDVLYDGFHDPKYRARPLLRSMVAAGKLGRKSGEGFYRYPASPPGSGEGKAA